ncbi:hypothetical protein DKX38_007138 [Salix brachista]|uniref:C2H2-type domain-containing protein n=1 Tax=Salix brachista TaxID=2182728 RepID=A0A5N5MME0_9ROSI|nr:hypothetical protein DKX38_007138 [Salix brachista]
MSNTTGDGTGSFSSGGGGDEVHLNSLASTTVTAANSNGSTVTQKLQQPPFKKKRNMPGNPDPSADVIALSPKTLMATNRFVCEICNKGFQRDQNLQLHRRGHNLPWKLKQRASGEIRKRVYICPEPSCVHHNPARALGDLTGIKKHFYRKHGEKKWKCDKCSKKYAVQSDWKAHFKTCGTKEYKCDCGTIFSRRDSFITHRAFCDALTEENNKVINQGLIPNMEQNIQGQISSLIPSMNINNNPNQSTLMSNLNHLDTKNSLSLPQALMQMPPKPSSGNMFSSSTTSPFGGSRSMPFNSSSALHLNANPSTIFQGNGHHNLAGSASMSATALLQKAAQMGATISSNNVSSPMMQKSFVTSMAPPTFGSIHTQNDQSHVIGGDDGYANQFFNSNGGVENSVLNEMGMFGAVLDQNNALFKAMEHASSNNESVFQGANSSSSLSSPTGGANPSSLSRFSGDMMTVDFLGIGGSRQRNLHDQHNHQEMEFTRGISHPRMQGSNHFEQQAGAIEKPLWDV